MAGLVLSWRHGYIVAGNRFPYFPFIAGAPVRAGSTNLSNQFLLGGNAPMALLDEATGIDVSVEGEVSYIQFGIQTGRTDLGNQLYKFIPRTEIVGDIRAGINAEIQYSDDDHTTFSAVRTVDLGLVRPRLSQNGRGRRRIFRVGRFNTNPYGSITGIRLEALELFVYGGHAG